MTRAAIGVDVGGTAVKAGVLLDGRVEAVLDVPTPSREGPEALIRLLAGAIEKLESGLPQEIIPCPLGIGCAGLVDTARGIVLTSPNLPAWKNAPLSELSETFLLRRAIILNDANAVALAESRHGAGVGSDHVIVITLGTGVGGGIVLNGRMWTGRHGFAGEIGHMPLVADGPVCACGSRGCVEAMIGTVAIVRRYRELAEISAEEVEASGGLSGSSDASPSLLLSPGLISEKARAGDTAALATWRETGRLLGLALGGLTNLLDPDLFVIGGGISLSADLMFPSARIAMAEQSLAPEEQLPGLAVAALGPAAGWIGAAFAALDAQE